MCCLSLCFVMIRKIEFIALLFTAFLLFNACEKDLDLTAYGGEKVLIYGLLDYQETEHYIRIERAYLDKNGNAYDVAQLSDSIYFADGDIEAKIIDQSNGQEFALERVSGDSLDVFKEDGIFSTTPNILYRFSGTLNPDHGYQINVYNHKNGQTTTAGTPLVKTARMLFPVNNSVQLDLVDTNKMELKWFSGVNARQYDYIIRFHYKEWDVSNPTQRENKTIEWLASSNVITSGLEGNEQMKASVIRASFYGQLAALIEKDENKRREPGKFDFILYGGGEELYKYKQVKIAQQGLASGSVLPTYTNINNGIGIFSSRTTTVVSGLSINAASTDTLTCGSRTEALNFVNTAGTLGCL